MVNGQLSMARDTTARDIQRVPTDPTWLRVLRRLRQSPMFVRDIGGLLLAGLGIATLFTLLGLNTGSLIGRWADGLQRAFGFGAYIIAVILTGLCVPVLLRWPVALSKPLLMQVIWGEIAFLAFLAFMHNLSFGVDPYQLMAQGAGGGAVGWVMSSLAWRVLKIDPADVGAGRILILLMWFVLFVLTAWRALLPVLAGQSLFVRRENDRSFDRLKTDDGVEREPAPLVWEPEPVDVRGGKGTQLTLPDPQELKPTKRRTAKPSEPAVAVEVPPAEKAKPDKARAAQPLGDSKTNPTIIQMGEAAAKDKESKAKGKEPPKKAFAQRPGTLPPLTLLSTTKQIKGSEDQVRVQAQVIEDTLQHFGLTGRVTEIRRGPTVTQFGIEPGYMQKGTINRDKARTRILSLITQAMQDLVYVEVINPTVLTIDMPEAIADAREANLKGVIKSILASLALSGKLNEMARKSKQIRYELVLDTIEGKKMRYKASHANTFQKGLAEAFVNRLLRFDDESGPVSDSQVDRSMLMVHESLIKSIDLKASIETALAELGLVGVIEVNDKDGYALIEWEKSTQKVRVGQIAALQNDFALALSAASLRIEAPIPGRGLVGLEVPNSSTTTVDLRGLLEGEAFRKMAEKAPLAFALGRDVSGTPINADLGRMPHLLIAGTTGSGKSVCISAICICLAMNNRPEDLKFVMIDPKMVELTRFASLPHLIGKPESALERIPAVLRWVVREMDQRYKKFAEVGSRNLQDYNDLLKKRGEEPLPRIVLMIDELADLMMQSPIETEKTLCRLAQMARATGIHMIVATQRPSVDVVTGLIKANFPARISFSVASSIDSRVILDQVGAESLLGRGDMLFLNPEAGTPMRVQGCWVSEKETDKVLDWWVDQIAHERAEQGLSDVAELPSEEEYVANKKPELDTPWDMLIAEIAHERAMASSGRGGRGGAGGGEGDDEGGDDELVKRAMDIIQASGSVSTSLLQRKLRIGYPRAARLMEELQEMGYVGGASKQAGKGREVKAAAEDSD